jgi:hypothetical protein
VSARVTVIIPTYNEEADIEACLSCVAGQDFDTQRIEVLVADGCSSDRTIERAEAMARGVPFARFDVLRNEARRTSAGLSLALSRATAPIIVRVDARSRIPTSYVRTVTEVLEGRPEAGVVGGAQVPLDRGSSTIGSGIARALSNRFTTGLSRYRLSETSGAADTVWMGAFRTDELRALGGWRADYGINEDYELNERYRAAGKIIWYDATLRSGYLPRPGLRSLGRQYLAFGRAKGAAWASGGKPGPRHIVLMSVPLLAGGAALLSARRMGLLRTMAAAFAALLVVDAVGARRQPSSGVVRVASVAATLTFAGAWWAGVIDGLLRGDGPRFATRRR